MAFPTATAVSYGLNRGRSNAYPQSIERRGQDVWINVDMCGLNKDNFAGESSERSIGKCGIGVRDVDNWFVIA